MNHRLKTSIRVAGLFGILLMVWLLWSWLFKPLILVLGVVSCTLVLLLVYRMDYFRSEHYALRFGPRLVIYWAWLGKEIFKSSVEVVRVILAPDMRLSPRTVDIDAGMLEPLEQALYANSLTLTPGTLALDVHEGVIRVHSLTHSAADDLMTGEMERRINALRR